MEDVDIFGELLGGKEQQSTSSKYQEPHSALDEDVLRYHESIQPQFVSKTEYSCIVSYLNSKGKTVLAHCEDDKFCYVLIDKYNSVSVQAYLLPPCKSSSVTTQPKIYHSFNTDLSSAFFQDEIHHVKKCQFLYAVHQASSSADSHHTSVGATGSQHSANITVQQPLFVYLFGQETACLRSPVLMLCASNGDVFSYILKSPNCGKLQLFCSVSGLVVGLTPIVIGREEPEDEQEKAKSKILDSIKNSLESRLDNAAGVKGTYSLEGFLVVGYSGESCLFLYPPGPGFTVPALCLLGEPVISCLAVGRHVVYSTGLRVETCQLFLCKREKQFSVSHRSHTLLHQANIRDLQLHNFGREKEKEEEEEFHLVGITIDHDMVHIATLENSGFSGGASRRLDFMDDLELDLQDNPGGLRDTLHRLNLHTEAIKGLQAKSVEFDSILQQLNLFATISQQQRMPELNSKSNNRQDDQGVCDSVLKCHCDLVCPGKDQPDAWKVRINLCNKSSMQFSNEWSVVVCETAILNCPGDVSSFNLPSASCFQFQLDDGLDAKSNITLTVPVVDSALFDHLLELQISVSLVLSMASLCKSRSSDVGSLKASGSLMEVEICQHSFDLLHFLQLSSSNRRSERCFSYDVTEVERENWLQEQLQKIAVHRIGDRVQSSESPDVKSQTFSVTIDLPDSYVEEKHISKSSEVLECLLNPKAVCMKETSSSFTSPGLQTLSLSVNERDAKDGSLLNQNRSNFSLRLKSGDVLTMFAVLEAVMKRIQLKPRKGDHKLSKEMFEYALQCLKRTRSDLMEDFKVIKFGSQPCEGYWTTFCHFLDNLAKLSTLEPITV